LNGLAAMGGRTYPHRVRRLTFIVTLTAFIFSCGGQWPFLQCLAWANMIREYSQMVPLAQAVHMTFSGQYPCAMCKAIAEKKRSDDNKVATLFSHEKKLFPATLVMKAKFVVGSPQSFVFRERIFQDWSESPPTPPPRSALSLSA